ncbi:MAG: hypothetical protein ACR2N0_06960 [Rubrobacteraceae bacterium]
MRNLPRIETLEQARETLVEMDDGQEITAGSGESEATITKHNDHEYSASMVDLETGVISLRDASHILLEHGGHDLRIG